MSVAVVPSAGARADVVSCRGLATYEKGKMPVPMDTIRQVLGRGVRAGIYPISDTEVKTNGPSPPPLSLFHARVKDLIQSSAVTPTGILEHMGACSARVPHLVTAYQGLLRTLREMTHNGISLADSSTLYF